MKKPFFSKSFWKGRICSTALLSLIGLGIFAWSAIAGPPANNLLAPNTCGNDWVMEGGVQNFDKENLFDHIDGEAELYFPYGFQKLSTAVFVNRKNADAAIVVDLYKMGSPLDAFGIYANYRKEGAAPADIGDEGFIDPTQLMFYQNAYFVRIQASSAIDLNQSNLLQCGRTLARKLPTDHKRPQILETLKLPGIVPKSERYIVQGLLGYDFLHRGLMAAAEHGLMEVIIVIENSPTAASTAFNQYCSYLKSSGGKDIQVSGEKGRQSLTARDPLYGSILLKESGQYLVGAVRIKDPVAAKQITEAVRKRLPAASS